MHFCITFLFPGAEIDKDMRKKGILWRKNSLQKHVNEVAYRGCSLLPEEIMQLESPMDLFLYFFDDEIIDLIVESTNGAARVVDIETKFEVKRIDILKFIGICLYMSVFPNPNIPSYWSSDDGRPMIRHTMPLKRFLSISRWLCFHDESQRKKKGEPGYDKLFRIRKLSTLLSDRFDSVPKTARLCVDEQMCSTKTKHHLRQYMPNKPHKWGVKLFVLCDSYGFAYKFEIYHGAGDNTILPGCPDLGASSNIVVRLSQTVPDFVHHIIYFDNFYTSIQLMVYLRSRGIYSLGTIRANRIPNCKLPTDNDVNEEPRGFSTEYCANVLGVDVNSVLWKDNKCVRLASTYVGVKPFLKANPSKQPSKVARYDRKEKKFVDVDCPQIIREYNSHMGGVDLMDGLMGRYKIGLKSRDIMMRLFYHMIDMAAVNAYVLHRRIHTQKLNNSSNVSAEDEKTLELPVFRSTMAKGLMTVLEKRAGRPPSRGAGDDSRSNSPLPPMYPSNLELPTGTRTKHVVADVRYDDIGHMSLWLPRLGGKKQCKHCRKSETQHTCIKCKVHLCNSASKNCMVDYHTPE